MSKSILRINEDIQRELSALLRNIKDPRINQGMISITSVNTANDLSRAKVYLSVYDLKSKQEFMKGLKSASGHLRYELGRALNLRHTPQLQFELDVSLERGSKIASILNELDKKKTLSPFEVSDWLKDHDNYLILTHKRPDGDTLGCAGALAQGLREYGKTVYVLYNPEATPRYKRFIDDYIAPDDFDFDHTIVVDTAALDLFPENAENYKDSVTLCIDHHGSNSLYADLICLDSDRASCGEIVFEILMALSGSISSVTAESLYVALSTDTGCFSFGNTTANTLYVASLLIEAGAPNKELNKQLFRIKTHGRISIESKLTSSIEYCFDDRVAIAFITREMIETAGADEDDMDDIAAIPGSVEGVYVGITIRELSSPEDCKISVRTRSPYDAQNICAKFGGGGHKLAAGCMIAKTIDKAKTALIEVLEEIM